MPTPIHKLKTKMEAAERALDAAVQAYESANSPEERNKARRLVVSRGKAESKAQNAYYAAAGITKSPETYSNHATK